MATFQIGPSYIQAAVIDIHMFRGSIPLKGESQCLQSHFLTKNGCAFVTLALAFFYLQHCGPLPQSLPCFYRGLEKTNQTQVLERATMGEDEMTSKCKEIPKQWTQKHDDCRYCKTAHTIIHKGSVNYQLFLRDDNIFTVD